jgi:hypothetical protein
VTIAENAPDAPDEDTLLFVDLDRPYPARPAFLDDVEEDDAR